MNFMLDGSKVRLTNPSSGDTLCAVVRRQIGAQIVVDVGDRAKTFLGHVEVECFNDHEHVWFDGLAIATLSTFMVVRPTSPSKALPRKHPLLLLETPLPTEMQSSGRSSSVKVVAVAERALAIEAYETIDMESDVELVVSWRGDTIRLTVVLEAQTVEEFSVEAVASVRGMSRVSRAVWTRLIHEASEPKLHVEPAPPTSRIKRSQSA
ncbi:MAG: hypothetical protein KF857_06075 [Fimbriimonadaceae bacterium]|nr:hypothetical protein [Fimbriimonadaceae bacterium]